VGNYRCGWPLGFKRVLLVFNSTVVVDMSESIVWTLRWAEEQCVTRSKREEGEKGGMNKEAAEEEGIEDRED
jgi:hypothetical protein